MAEIRLISNDMVQAPKIHGDPIDRIELTPWDLQVLLLGPITRGLIFLKPTPLQEKELFANNVIEHLKTSFARALEFFYPLAGRLGVVGNEDDTTSFFIDCNNAGAYFIHAVAHNVTINDIFEPLYTPPIVSSFFPMIGKVNMKGDTNPLLAVQVNELSDGFFIGCTINHAVIDGSSFWHFFNSWSEISRGLNQISRMPVFKRWFPSEIEVPIRIPSFVFSNRLFYESNSPQVEERIFHFSKEKIKELKANANAKRNTTNISSLQALLAHLWQSMIRSQKIEYDQELSCLVMVSARQRLQPPLPECYFGNAAKGVVVSTTADELLKSSVGEIACQFHHEISSQTSDVFVNQIKTWSKSFLKQRSQPMKNYLLTSSNVHFNLYGVDFGWGKPIAVRSGSGIKIDGKAMFFPGAEEGSIDVEVGLSLEKLIALGNDKNFMETVTM